MYDNSQLSDEQKFQLEQKIFLNESAAKQDTEQIRKVEESIMILMQQLYQEENNYLQQKLIQAQESEKLALQLQQEEESLLDQRMREENPELNCQICYDKIQEEGYLPLDTCGHIFHQECVKNFMQVQISDKNFPIICPAQDCKIEISQLDIQERLNPEEYEKYNQFQFKHFIEGNQDVLSCCPTPDCEYVFEFDWDHPLFQCPACTKQYCLDCKSDWHNKYTCEQYQKIRDPNNLDQMFMQFARGQQYKQCPHCNFWVEKTTGCNALSCRCGNVFCYGCGEDSYQCTCYGQQPIRVPVRRAPVRRARRRRRR